MSGQPTVCTCLPPFPKEGGTLYGLPVFHHEPGCPMPYEPEAAAPSPSVDEARGQLFDHFREWASGASVPDPALSVDALVAAVRREEQQKAREALAAPGTPDSVGTEERVDA